MKFLRWGGLILFVVLVIVWSALPGIVEVRNNRVTEQPPYRVSPQAEGLHKQLVIADLHADSLLWGRDLLQRVSRGHVDIPRLIEGGVAVQAFTVVTTVPKHLNINQNSDSTDLIQQLAIADGWPPRTWNSPKQRALYQASRLQKFADRSRGALVLIRSRSDLESFLNNRKRESVAAFLGSEGAQPLEGKLENLDELYDAGFRMMAPAHFTDTAVGGSAAGVRKHGLTELGKRWVRRMEDKSMLIDLAHSSPATIRDVTALATRPLVVSHTGVRGTCDNNRNLSDDQLRAITRTGGVIGIGYWPEATCGQDAAAVARAIRHAVNVVGVEHVGLGSDFDGSTTMPFDATGLKEITEALLNQGFSQHEIELIMGQNTINLLLKALPQ
jgi:membrane dipeptidase